MPQSDKKLLDGVKHISNDKLGSCPICSSALLAPERDEWKVRQCPACGHAVGSVAWVEQFASSSKNYFDLGDYVEYRRNNSQYFELIAKDRFKFLANELDFNSAKSLLEIGCSTGEFLSIAKSRGLNVVGNDTAVAALQYAKQTYDVSVFDDLKNLKGRTFDVVCALHVIEHVKDPKEFIQLLEPFVALNGYLYLRMPNYSSLNSSIFKKNWPGLSIEHTQFFSIASISKLLGNNGLQVSKVTTASHARHLLGSLRRFLNGGSRPLGSEGAGGNGMPTSAMLKVLNIAALFLAPLALLERTIGRGDELVIVARKLATRE